MTRTDAGRMDAMERKLDQLIELSHAREIQLQALSQQVAEMAPTVKIGENVITTARTMNSVARWAGFTAPFVVAFFYWMADRWHLIGQLFKRAG